MNRPTIDVDDLLELADEAISAGDQAQAVAILRKATTIAPLRRDIKNRLAIVLEGTPVAVKPAERSRDLERFTFEEDVTEHDQEQEFHQAGSGLDSISQIARRAFDAAATQKAKAGDATRKLTNLLQTGLGNWKSSLAAPDASSPKKSQVNAYVPEAINQSSVFKPEEELKQYLERAAVDDAEATDELDDTNDLSTPADSTAKLIKPPATSKKSARNTTPSKSSKRPTDVEDVLAAGIGGFIEAIGRTDKVKLLYACVYVGLIALFGFACFDISRKFPQLTATTGSDAAAASIGADYTVAPPMSTTEALEKAQSLVKSGNYNEAVALLESQLAQGQLLHNRDLYRAELASVLNLQAENYLKENQLTESVETYRKANKHLPGDARLQLRLANALYYHGLMGTSSDAARKESLEEAGNILDSLIKADAQNIQGHRLKALLHEAQNNSSLARASWQKVKTLAPAGSAILTEAKSRLK